LDNNSDNSVDYLFHCVYCELALITDWENMLVLTDILEMNVTTPVDNFLGYNPHLDDDRYVIDTLPMRLINSHIDEHQDEHHDKHIDEHMVAKTIETILKTFADYIVNDYEMYIEEYNMIDIDKLFEIAISNNLSEILKVLEKYYIRDGVNVKYNENGIKIYEGEFIYNKYHGQGILYYDDGYIQYKGTFENNYFHGQGIYYNENGIIIYEGEFKLGDIDGYAIAYNDYGQKIYEGEFKNDLYNGYGILYNDTGIKIYEGNFIDSKYHGEGILYNNIGNVELQGEFKDNEFIIPQMFSLEI
jgi:antitoxin component YwqK of YwqJK toxin-antitoxin module